ncbi:MAG: class I SAM-dependent methyltransferase [Chloroflexota bacterium]
MARLSLASGRLSVEVEVPDAWAGRLRRARRSLRRGAHGRGSVSAEGLVFRPPPELHVERRDASEALPLVEELLGAGRNGGDTPSNDLAAAVASRFWYHTIELPGGVVTPGYFDHRALVSRYGLPGRLDGQRVLDVAAFDGFWTFELEARGADVLALDVPRLLDCDLPGPVRDALARAGLDHDTGAGFALAKEALGSRALRKTGSVYDLDAADVGTFDLVHLADLLVHLEAPLAALRAIRRVTRGRALIADCFDPNIRSGHLRYHGGWRGFTWWVPSLDALAQMVLDAGFSDVSVHTVYSLPYRGASVGPWRACLVAKV